jgi:hypothetical protein
VLEVCCETCGDLVLDVAPDRTTAVGSKADHIAVKLTEEFTRDQARIVPDEDVITAESETGTGLDTWDF